MFLPVGLVVEFDWLMYLPVGTVAIFDWLMYLPADTVVECDWLMCLPVGTVVVFDWLTMSERQQRLLQLDVAGIIPPVEEANCFLGLEN